MLNRACVSGACLQLSAPPLQLSALRWNGADIVWRHYPAFVSGLLMDPQSNDVPCSSKLLPPHTEADRRIGGVGGRLHGRGGLLNPPHPEADRRCNPVIFRTCLFFLVGGKWNCSFRTSSSLLSVIVCWTCIVDISCGRTFRSWLSGCVSKAFSR